MRREAEARIDHNAYELGMMDKDCIFYYDYLTERLTESPLTAAEKRKIRKDLKRRKLRTSLMITFVAVFVSVLLTVFAVTMVHHAEKADNLYLQPQVAYTSILVHPGDTLWTIADREMGDDSKSREQFIDAVIHVNGLSGDRINAGAYLCIPHV